MVYNKYDEKLKQCLKNILEKIVSLPEENRWDFFVNEREYDRVAELLMKAQNETFFNQLLQNFHQYNRLSILLTDFPNYNDL